MGNPILQMLGKNNPISSANQIIGMMQGNNPNAIYNQLMQSNPQFKRFVEANKGKSPEQIAKENGLYPGILNQFRK